MPDPFRLYDFDSHKAMDVWQLPLNVMDVTLLDYMNLLLKQLWKPFGPLWKR